MSNSFVGAETSRAICNVYVDRLVFSVKGIEREGFLTDPDSLEAEVKRAMVERARTVVLVAAGRKFDERGLHVIAHATKVHVAYLADAPFDGILTLEQAGVQVHVERVPGRPIGVVTPVHAIVELTRVNWSPYRRTRAIRPRRPATAKGPSHMTETDLTAAVRVVDFRAHSPPAFSRSTARPHASPGGWARTCRAQATSGTRSRRPLPRPSTNCSPRRARSSGDHQIGVPAPGGGLRSREVRHFRVRVSRITAAATGATPDPGGRSPVSR